MRILLAISQTLWREGLVALLTRSGHSVVAEVANADEALIALRGANAEMVLLYYTAGPGELEALLRLVAQGTAPSVVLLGEDEESLDMIRTLAAGAVGFLSTALPGEELLAQLENISQGALGVSARTARALGRQLRGANAEGTTELESLTVREREVLAELARGTTTNRDLAEALQITENTAKFHVRNILEKLDLHSRAEVVAYAHRLRPEPRRGGDHSA